MIILSKISISNRPGASPSGLLSPNFERGNCGIGFIARIDGKRQHTILRHGIQALMNLEHRGAIGGDKSTGDGAGLLLQIPHQIFLEEFKDRQFPARGNYAIAMVFLPQNAGLAGRCIQVIEHIVKAEGCDILGWRKVPVDNSKIGNLARSTEPQIHQLVITQSGFSQNEFERKLYVIRRLVEKQVGGWKDPDFRQFYIVSLSSRNIVYKGLLTATQLPLYYPDLLDNRFESAFALVHQRYSTNTLPTWKLAQPFRFIAHNGEFNTLRGNINRMRAREAMMESDLFGDVIEKIKPVIDESGSDSAIFDNVLELIVMGGRSLPHAMMMMIPEAYGRKIQMSEDKRSFYEFHSAIMEPWDGPAALVFSDGRYIGATLDRNGLRPARYTVTHDGLIVLASETGVLDLQPEDIRSRGRLQPGKMFLVDLEQNRIVPDHEIKAKISRQRPYRRWINDNGIELRGLFMPSLIPPIEPEVLLRHHHAFGYTDEELYKVINPMASRGQEAVGSMGNDAALSIFSNRPQLLFSYFKQLFAQVTNPPIDPLREELVMSLESFLGRENNFLDESPAQYRGLKIRHPILSIRDMLYIREANHPDVVAADIDILFPVADGAPALEAALEKMFQTAEKHIANGVTIIVLTDLKLDEQHEPIPSLLATSALHHYLIKKELRTSAAIIVETGEAREVMHFALLIAYGADAICPDIAFHTVRNMAEADLLEKKSSPEAAMDAYITAIRKGLLKTCSRMGISTIHSFFGSQIFEAVGLGKELVDTYFCGTPSRIGGIGLVEIAAETLERHRRAFPPNRTPAPLLDIGGQYHVRVGGEKHLWSPEAIYKLQLATRINDNQIFKEYARLINDQSENRATLRSLFRFKQRESIPIDEVESVESIVHRFSSAAMSFGSISREAHEAIAIAMNRLGAKSNSGEGGEDPARLIPLPNGDSKRSGIKQIASGRFGVTTEYLVNADELQIKMAQGAKPGEGGQLPGHKVSEEIARVRHTTPGVTLISPPPHHDIYSIEDLAQLIYDLKSVNSKARVSVKLVSEVGVGTIAAGVAKANADMVLISGHDGGTGASPLTAIKHAGLPWELGLAETQQSLIANRLRDRIRIQVDGQLKTGRDLAIAALLGAEEFGFGTTILVTLGCVMMRKCHLNTCPVGVATQDKKLRQKFTGKPEYVERFLTFIAQDLREIMAQLGFKTLDDMIGRADVLDTESVIEHWKSKKLDLTSILYQSPREDGQALRCTRSQTPLPENSLNNELLKRCEQTLEHKTPVQLELPISNVDRAVGATLSAEITRRFGSKGLPENTIQLSFRGSAGQSLGAFLAPGIHIRVAGDANDYMGKGMSGGRIVLVPPPNAGFLPHENIIAGNVVLYGATGGEIYINGIAGERFAVRNSGATAVVEGIGDHGCEYMTGGVVVVIGSTGKNFAAGMSGGIAYVYDKTELFDTKCNLDMVDLESVWNEDDRQQLQHLLENHFQFTQSPAAKTLLDNWEAHVPLFVKVIPIDYKKSLERMRLEESMDRESVAATEEVYHG
ncbi:glutamate synthase large subunit [candidate division KSB1 bacterium]|nr:glutamate synthase large subunit [candidate division KSB1 bacterium]